MPVFDAAGRLVRLTIATEGDLLRKLRETVGAGLLPLETAVRIFSTNAADFYKLGRKGRLEPGRDADILLLDAGLGLVDVFARGRRMMAAGRLLSGAHSAVKEGPSSRDSSASRIVPFGDSPSCQ
jgi:beta-aspartyl-dipeptidase (metallo-type)